MSLRNVLLGFGGAAAVVHVASYIMMMAALDRRGYKTNILLSRIFFYKYIKAYRDAMVKETGKPGPLYNVCLLAVCLTLVFVAAAIIATHR
jgi:hypothetical protein